jgi:hypothetical protein
MTDEAYLHRKNCGLNGTGLAEMLRCGRGNQVVAVRTTVVVMLMD